ncbi:hypothetical protein PAJL_2221 [Cutibacterium acnes HL042PA3]|nr:hypothetical protein HMPREF9619_01323 [Cutibacterium acnes HL082PA2]EFT25996.1 hypothetical protein HMPREF9577_01365 [Cutibacterium acnes HL110PA3]EFT62694.1 hypothetical protein HMPREF9578_01973 [Cutibacterium acnes HL110PA4]EFT66942.1 hypothetical protein HMPREF9582_02021 [Cutibacterium acnes HL060PA1]EFT76167.1 hypothetical protein HMPREF9599_02455 [Cutibacterium acnes HL050PA2]EGE69869.1 hypothetical protein HMPREF9341_01151 [Cutibacterium acnes HL103PA1]ESK58202.1 hypothetical protein
MSPRSTGVTSPAINLIDDDMVGARRIGMCRLPRDDYGRTT